MKKGDIIEGVIEDIKYPNKGEFHVQTDGEDGKNWRVEVKNALPGQRVQVRALKKKGGRVHGMLLDVLEKAPGERTVQCPSYGKCGGCLYLGFPYEQEMQIKGQQVWGLLQDAVDAYVAECRKVAAETATCSDDGTAGDVADESCTVAVNAGEQPCDAVEVTVTEAGPCDHAETVGGAAETAPMAATDAGAPSIDLPCEPWMTVSNWMEPTAASPVVYGYRNKMEFTFGDEIKDGPMTLGMHKRGSFYDVVDADQCELVDPDFHTVVRITRELMTERRIPFYHRMRQEGYLRHLLVRRASHTGEILIDLVTTTQIEPAEETTLLEAWTQTLLAADYKGTIAGILHTRNDSIADVIEDQGTDVLYGRSYFEETLLGLRFIVTPFSFFQTNSYGAEVLYDIAREYVASVVPAGERPVIYDLYCGTGTISQLVAPVASEVIGVEIVEEAVEAAKENAARNGITNCTFYAGDVLKVVPTIETRPDLLILDPPRDGIHPKAMPHLLSYGVDNILYISCKPTSLARDLPAFLAAGYRPVRGRVVDSFCWTTGVETVVLMSRVSNEPCRIAGE